MKEEDIQVKIPTVKKMPSPRASKPEKKKQYKKEISKKNDSNDPFCSVGFQVALFCCLFISICSVIFIAVLTRDKSCPSGCLRCDSPKICVICEKNYKLFNNTCHCNAFYNYKVDNKCQACTLRDNKCIGCIQGWYV